MRIKSIFILTLVFCLTFITTQSSFANENQLTSEEYVDYLTTQIKNGDTEAQDTLNKFNALETSKQEAFINFLYSDEYIQSLNSLTRGENVQNNVVIDGVSVPVDITLESPHEMNQAFSTSSNALSATSTYATSASASRTLKAFNIDTTTLTLTGNWNTDGSKAISPISLSYSHTNRNPAISITERDNNYPGTVSGGYYLATGNWTLSAFGKVGGLSDTITINIKAKTFNDKYWSSTSTHSNIPSTPWTKY